MDTKIVRALFLVLMLTMLMLVSCAPAATPSAAEVVPVEVVDGLGRSLSLPAAPQRIISMAPSNTELLFAVGAGSRVVGRDEFSDYPEAAKAVESIGGSMGKYNLEQIAALQPDLVLAAEINTPEQVQAIEDLGLNVYYLKNPADLAGMLQNITIVGQLTGNTAEASSLVGSLQARLDKVQKLATDAPVTVFYELDGLSDPTKPWTVGSGTYIDEMLNLLGASNVAAEAGAGWLQLSQEALIVADPQVILLGDGAYGVTVESLAARPGWEGISAVKSGKVYLFDDNLVSRPGPRLVDGLETLAGLLSQ